LDATSFVAEERWPASSRVWIQAPRWDLGWLIGSAAIVPLVLLAVWGGASSSTINLATTALIGGPHLFSTYTATYLDPRFRRSHRPLLWAASIGVPALVVWGALADFQVLLSVFIFAASVHVLHQNAYLTDIYRRRAGVPEPSWSRLVDYGLLMLCIYPIAAWKLVRHDFLLGDIEILIPAFLRTALTYWLVWIVFTLLLAAWLAKSWSEARRGVLNGPKTILISVTVTIAFLVPLAAAGERLELAFQAVNAWHSFQYLGVVWLIQRVRREQGMTSSPWVRAITGGSNAAWRFYGACLAVTLALLGVLILLAKLDPLGLAAQPNAFERYYYMGVLSCLLIHYALDGWLFTVSNLRGVDARTEPYATPALA
jgi:hypothetical protein